MRQLNTGHYPSKFATSWICFGRIFKPLEAGRLVRFQKAGKYMHLGKTQCWNLFAICKATLFYFHYDSDKIKIAHYYPKLRTTAQAIIITHFQAKIRQIFKFSMAIKFRTCKGKFSFAALLIYNFKGKSLDERVQHCVLPWWIYFPVFQNRERLPASSGLKNILGPSVKNVNGKNFSETSRKLQICFHKVLSLA